MNASSSELERLVDLTPAIDEWCSGPDWSLPANAAFAPDCERLLVGDLATGVAVLGRYRSDNGRTTISGLEPLWGFGSPILGPDPIAIAREIVDALTIDQDWNSIILPGLPLSSEILNSIAIELGALGEVGVGIAIEREVADLSKGGEQWLQRRSSRFRRNLRRAERTAANEGVEYLDVSSEPGVFARLLQIESASWKGKEGSGITAPDMAQMYEHLTDRLAANSRLRATVATRAGEDIGFILGGVRGSTYRGLQLSYTEAAAGLSIGHLLQWHELRTVAASNTIAWYDLGMSIEYKAQWSDKRVPSPLLIVNKSPKFG